MNLAGDAQVRAAAFCFLEAEVRRLGTDVLPRTLLAQGFRLGDRRVPLVGPAGIFKPAVLPEMPLSITTVPVGEGQAPPYRDVLGRDGLLRYCCRGTDPYHRDNVGLRLARERQAPLIYCHGVVAGLYAVVWPVFIVNDSPSELMFTVSVDDRQLAGIGPRTPKTLGPRGDGATSRGKCSSACIKKASGNAFSQPIARTAQSAVSGIRSCSRRRTSFQTVTRTESP